MEVSQEGTEPSREHAEDIPEEFMSQLQEHAVDEEMEPKLEDDEVASPAASDGRILETDVPEGGDAEEEEEEAVASLGHDADDDDDDDDDGPVTRRPSRSLRVSPTNTSFCMKAANRPRPEPSLPHSLRRPSGHSEIVSLGMNRLAISNPSQRKKERLGMKMSQVLMSCKHRKVAALKRVMTLVAVLAVDDQAGWQSNEVETHKDKARNPKTNNLTSTRSQMRRQIWKRTGAVTSAHAGAEEMMPSRTNQICAIGAIVQTTGSLGQSW